MAFDQTSITEGPVVVPAGQGDTLIWWSSTAPEGTYFQLYIDHHLYYSGTDRRVTMPTPSTNVYLQVGTVDPDEAGEDLSSTLPSLPGNGGRAVLTWVGGTYLDPDIAGYHVYSGTTPGGAVSYSNLVGDVPAYAAGIVMDGYGMGGYGQGGYGLGSSNYRWVSERLSPGTWNFGVKPYNKAGVEGTASTVAVAITGPPNPPARAASGKRLTYTYNAGTGKATLAWLAPV